MAVLGTENLGMFIAAGLLLNITPGADMLFIASRSAAQGPRAGIVAALGIGAGCLVHILGAPSACRWCWQPRPWPSPWSNMPGRSI